MIMSFRKRRPTLHSKMNNARNAIAIFFIYPTKGGLCWHIDRFCMQDQGMKKNVWIATKIWFTTRNPFMNTNNTKQLIGGWVFNPHIS
jgi:hypothetical protein